MPFVKDSGSETDIFFEALRVLPGILPDGGAGGGATPEDPIILPPAIVGVPNFDDDEIETPDEPIASSS